MRKRWLALLLTLPFAALLVLATRASSVSPLFGDPLPGLTPDEQDRFVAGKAEFQEVEDTDEGLGPVFNESSCAACHSGPAVGGGSTVLETRFGTITDDAFDPMLYAGGSLIQSQGIGRVKRCNYVGEAVPREATIVAPRRTPPLFGLGLVDAVPDADFQMLAAREAADDRINGRPNIVMNLQEGRLRVGKFGWKAQVPSLAQFSADAYLNEMGVTSPLFPSENCPQGDCKLLACNPTSGIEDDGTNVREFADFMTFLAPPPPGGGLTTDVGAGQGVFLQIGCAACHQPTLRTGPNPVAALDKVEFHPYSDFLLHDMGTLGDGIEQGLATGREMRTAPLWGVGSQVLLLHDGRTGRLEDAILAHDGQARAARDRFADLTADRKRKLIAFLKSL